MAPEPPTSAPLMQWSDLIGRPKPTLRPERIKYGEATNQIVDLWRPATPGPHPVVVMIHGGCWQAKVASFHIMDQAAADLASRGVAVWNLEYRGVDQPGGGYPGTYRDVAAALDKLQAEATARGLRTGGGLVVIGHSAGGHLALWSAGHARQAQDGPLNIAGVARIRAVIDLAGIPDLADPEPDCEPFAVAAMRGEPGPGRPDAYADTSPAHMLPLSAELFVIHGAQDETVPPEVGARFAAKARAAGDKVTVITPPGGHVEEIAPGSQAWEETVALVLLLVAR